MLALSKLLDLLSGKLSDKAAYEFLLAMSQQKPNAAALNELITAIIETSRLRSLALAVNQLAEQENVIDCSGTGGSGIPHYNTSTSVSFVLAARGLKVAKFGNRAASGISGSFDFLEYLGFPIVSRVEALLSILQSGQLCFLYAPDFYPALAKLAPIRKALGKPTLFNLAGPLLNPFFPAFRILGAPTSEAQSTIADYLFLYKACKKALVVRAHSGLDELDPSGNNEILAIDNLLIKPSMLNLNLAQKNSSATFITAKENAKLFFEMIKGDLPEEHYFSIAVKLNAGAGFFAAGKSSSIEEGQNLANALLSSGAVLDKYEQCRKIYSQNA